MTFHEFIGGLIEALVDGYGNSKERNQERLDERYEKAYNQAQIDLKDLGQYDPEKDGKFISVMEGCEND